MTPRTAYRNALILIPVSIVIGIVAVILSNWFVVGVMVLSVAFQTVNLRSSRRRLNRRDRK
jgi:hypothetical protein